MSRRSRRATPTLVSELNVLSTTPPVFRLLILVRTTACPLPGLWCWNSTTSKRPSGRWTTRPRRRSFVAVGSRVVDQETVPIDLRVGRRGARLRRIGARGDDGLEGHGLGPRRPHGPLDSEREIELGTAGECFDRGPHGVLGELLGSAQCS